LRDLLLFESFSLIPKANGRKPDIFRQILTKFGILMSNPFIQTTGAQPQMVQKRHNHPWPLASFANSAKIPR
jgi:hypothetical protein